MMSQSSTATAQRSTAQRAAVAPIRRSHAHAGENTDGNSWQSRPRCARASHEAVLFATRCRASAARCSVRSRRPRPLSSRQMCARSCRMRAHRLHRFPGGLLHPTVDLSNAFECEMPNMTSDDGAARPPTPAGRGMGARSKTARCKGQVTADISSYRALVQLHQGVIEVAPTTRAAAQGNFGTPCSRRWCTHAHLARTGFPSSLPTRSCSFLVALRCRCDAIHTRRGRVRRLHCGRAKRG